MNVEQMSVADLLREGKQAMALALGVVGLGTRDHWADVAAEIDLRLSVGDIDEGDLEGRVQAAVKAAVDAAQMAVADKNAALKELAKAIAERDRAYQQIKNNATNLQFVQDEFNKNHPALKGEWGSDLSRGAMLLWAWAQDRVGEKADESVSEIGMAEEKTDMKGKRWSFEEKIQLVMMVKPGFKLKDAADMLGRTTGGVKSQLRALALVKNCRLTSGVVIGDVVWAERWCGSRIDQDVRSAVYGSENQAIHRSLIKDNGWVKSGYGFILPVSGKVE